MLIRLMLLMNEIQHNSKKVTTQFITQHMDNKLNYKLFLHV